MLDAVQPEDIAAEVMMTRAAHPGATVLLVEGIDDIGVFSPFLRSAELIAGYGKPLVLAALSLLESDGFAGILAITDADFDRLQGVPMRPNVIATDTHDLETMIVKSPALDRILAKFASSQKIAKFLQAHAFPSIRDAILERAHIYGVVRLLSHQRALRLRFAALDYDRLIEKQSLSTWASLARTRTGGAENRRAE